MKKAREMEPAPCLAVKQSQAMKPIPYMNLRQAREMKPAPYLDTVTAGSPSGPTKNRTLWQRYLLWLPLRRKQDPEQRKRILLVKIMLTI